MKNEIDALVKDAVFSPDDAIRADCRRRIREIAAAHGAYPASIQGLYQAAGKGLYSGKSVPAINIRGITYQVARAVFRAALAHRVGALIFEIARSEIGYTAQRPDEYAVCVLAAAVREGFRGPVFLQGDHFQVNAKKFQAGADAELGSVRDLIREAVDAGFYNIDIDASTLVDLTRPSLEEQQENNCVVTADMTRFIRGIEPPGVTISVGGEIGEVGKQNSTVADLRAFMSGYLERLGPDVTGISKISVQTGTAHGGVVMPDGSLVKVKVDFETLEKLSEAARREYGLAGAVQHGASTLPDTAFDNFPRVNTVEVHLATGFQNIIYESPYFPEDLMAKINAHLKDKYRSEKKPDDTEDQFLYKTRKKAFGDFKREMWDLPPENLDKIRDTLEERFALLFHKLAVTDTVALVERYVS
ncbi:MAG: class II fructose-bisphosphate aldolase [Dehalococcoidales bacterium]|nr:class II fructose-bisphosphate aldolase [Dehalococcoidales bacterium]